MLKTFIASIRSDKAVKELDKLGIKVKEVGGDGVERFRDVQQVILDIAVQTRYAEKDIQKTLLAISGGKFQWAKVAAMLSDYKEIINNWEMAINSQGFTDKQVEEQLDTVARKFQSLKDEITGIIVNGGSGGISSALKNILDLINDLLRGLNSIGSTGWKIISFFTEFAAISYTVGKIFKFLTPVIKQLGIKELAKDIKLATKGVNGLGKSFITMEKISIASINKVKKALSRFLPTMIAMTVIEGYGFLKDRAEANDPTSEAMVDKKALEYDTSTRAISILKQKKNYVDGLTSAYASLLIASKDVNLSEEKRKEINSDIQVTEEKLASKIGQTAVDRIKNSEDVATAAQKEANEYKTKSDKVIEDAKRTQQAVIQYADAQQEAANKLIETYQREKEEFLNDINAKIEGTSALAKAEIAYWNLRQKFSNWRASGIREDIARLEKYKKNLEEQYAKKADADLVRDYDEINRQIEAKKKDLDETEDAIKYYHAQQFEAEYNSKKEDALKILKNVGAIKGNANQSSPSGGTETNDTDANKKRSKMHRRPAKTSDPIVIAIQNATKAISEKFDTQIKTLEENQNDFGASKENTLAKYNTYSNKMNELSLQRDKMKAHLKERDAKLFSGVITEGITSQLGANITAEAEKWRGTKYVFGGTTKDGIDCSAFVQNVYTALGIGISRAADVQAEEFINKGAFQKSLDGAKDGDLVFFSDGDGISHVGIVSGRNDKGHLQMINSATSTGVANADLEEGYWAERFTGLGRVADYSKLVMSYNETLSSFLTTLDGSEKPEPITKEMWESTGVEGQKKIIEAAMKLDENHLSDQQYTFLNDVLNQILGSIDNINALTKEIDDTTKKQKDTLFSDVNKEISFTDKKVERETNKTLYALGSGATETDKATLELEKFRKKIAVINEILSRKEVQGYKGTEQYNELIDINEQSKFQAVEASVKQIQAEYNDTMHKIEHNTKMRSYGLRDEDDLLGRKKATNELRDQMFKVDALRKERDAVIAKDPNNYMLLDSIDEQIKEATDKLKESQTKYQAAIREGFEKIAEEFIFEGKSFKDIITNIWQDLGKDALKVLFKMPVTNPSFLGQALGLGMADKDAVGGDAAINAVAGTITSATNSLNNTVGVGSPLANNLGQITTATLQGMTKEMMLTTALTTNTAAVVANTAALGMSGLTGGSSGAGGGILGAIWSGVKGADLKSNTGGILGIDGRKTLPKFATGGSMAGKVRGAGTGRSDDILTYLANKDKFVWLSNGEYVINEKSAKALGYDTLDALNGYSTGGALETSVTNPTPYVPTINPQVAQRATTIHGSNKVTEALLREQNKHMMEQNAMLRNMGESDGGKMVILNTQASSADVLRALQENPRALQAIMGRQKSMGFR